MNRLGEEVLLPQTAQSLEMLDAQASRGKRFARIEVDAGSRRPLYSRPFDPEIDGPLDIDPFDHYGVAFGEDYVAIQRVAKHLKVGIFSIPMAESDHAVITQSKREAQTKIFDGMRSALPRFGDRVVHNDIENLQDIVRGGHRVDLRIAIGDFANIGSDVSRPIYDTTPTVLLKMNHQFERKAPAGMGHVVLDGKRAINTDNAEDLADYNNTLDREHHMTLARLRRLGFVAASAVINPQSGHEHDGVVGLSLSDVDASLASALRVVSDSRR